MSVEITAQSQPTQEVNKLVHILERGTKKNANTKDGVGFSCRKSTFPVEGTEHTVDSWKFQDWDYKKRDLPTYARGLFTYRNPRDGNYEITVRGYDKFFNIDEVYKTKWDWIVENTKPPYELTVKENGCIIFISGLPDGTLLVCSKHSTGSRGDIAVSHANAGEKWVDRQLEKLGKTRQDLALALREANITAVAELCDDSFEEHILAYEEDRAGLYLHGLNLNLPEFATYSAEAVQKFADEWGFRKIDFFKKHDVESLKQFLQEAAETGSWDGKDVEGFVIRCKARNGPNDPYWHDWFFKYKFEEPYLMYRQWREVTKAFIAGKTPKYKKHTKITKEYISFAARYFQARPGATKAYQANHGIIKLRDEFLNYRGLKGSDIIKMVQDESGVSTNVTNNVILVPIATIGCGKTTVAVALTKLFDWGHIQNDNITVRKGKPQMFASSVCAQLVEKPVVIADRNNHQKRERQQLFEDVSKIIPEARFVALHYNHYPEGRSGRAINRIAKASQDRVFARGDNHQTIQAGSKRREEIIGIMSGFIARFEPANPDSEPDSLFDHIIDLDPEAESRVNLEKVIKTLKEKYPKLLEVPDKESMDEAIKEALSDYSPDLKHNIKSSSSRVRVTNNDGDQKISNNQQPGNNKKQKQSAVEYFSVNLPASSITDLLESTFSSLPSELQSFYTSLKSANRIQPAFHLTLIHRTSSKSNPDIWNLYQRLLDAKDGNPGADLAKTHLRLDKIVWDGKVMAIAATPLEDVVKVVNEVPHVTIGTANAEVKPKMANDMLVKWKRSGEGFAVDVGGEVVLEGFVRAVLSR
ncbi:tRNA ligase [Rhizina undulata]